jgi:hypothetical protein
MHGDLPEFGYVIQANPDEGVRATNKSELFPSGILRLAPLFREVIPCARSPPQNRFNGFVIHAVPHHLAEARC